MATKVTYTPTTWADGTEGGTPIDAAKLNNIEQGVSDTATLANANMDDIATLKDSISLKLITGSATVSTVAGTTAYQINTPISVPSGYKIVAVLRVNLDHNKTYSLTSFWISNNEIRGVWAQTGTSTFASITTDIAVLCAKSSIVG